MKDNNKEGYTELIDYLRNDGAIRVLDILKESSDSVFLTKYQYLVELALPKFQRADPKVGGGGEKVTGIDVTIE